MRNVAISDKKKIVVTETGRLGASVVAPFLILSFINQPTPTLLSLLYKCMKKLKIKTFLSEKNYDV